MVAVDGVNDAPVVLASRLSCKRGFFVFVIPAGGGGDMMHNNVDRVESYMARKKAEEELAKPKYKRDGWTVQVLESDDAVGKALCQFAERVKADVLVIGHSTKFSLDHLLLGSNAVYCTKVTKRGFCRPFFLTDVVSAFRMRRVPFLWPRVFESNFL